MSNTNNTAMDRAMKAAERIERFASDLDALFQDKTLPELVAPFVASPSALALLKLSRAVALGNPFSPFMGESLEVPKGLKAAKALAGRLGLAVEVVEANPAFDGWAKPGRSLGVADAVFLLEECGAEREADGRFRFHGIWLDPVALTVAGKPVKAGLVVSPDGQEVFSLSVEEMWAWIVVGALQGIRENPGSAARQFTGFLRVMYAKAAEKVEGAYSDPAHQAFLASKRPFFQLGWTTCGYTLRGLEKSSAEQFALASSKRLVGAHGQGKFLVDLHAEVLGVEVKLDGQGGTPLVYMASTAAAKWFKRLTLGRCLQVRPVNPDVSAFQNPNSGESHGRKVGALLLECGLNFPYLGNAVSLRTRAGMASLLSVVEDVPHVADWVGTHAPVLPAVGSKVKSGQVLAAGPDNLVATVHGTVVEATAEVNDNKTTVKVIVANFDRTGQAKLRSELFKLSVAYPRWISPDWTGVAQDIGLADAQVSAGDVAILDGLEPSDQIDILGNEDVVKAWGKGNRQGLIAAAANTLGRQVVYSPVADVAGAYDQLVEDFKAVSYRKEVLVGYAVTNEIADAIEAAGRNDVAITRLRGYSLAIQSTAAWVVKDVVKVESLSVRRSETEGYVPLEVAAAARSMIGAATAAMLAGNGEQFEVLETLHTFARPEYNPDVRVAHEEEALASGTAINPVVAALSGFTVHGRQVLGTVPIVDLATVNESQMAALRNRAVKPLELPGPIAFVDSQDGLIAIVHPKVLKAFGVSDSESSLVSLFSQLCAFVGAGDKENAKQALRQLRGAIGKIAVSPAVNQRAFRGVRTLQAKTSAGNVARGWVAIGYGSSVAKRLVRLFGFDKLSQDELAARGWLSPVDGLWGQVVLVYRAPQTAPVPLRIYMPDAPQVVLDFAVEGVDVPVGAIYKRSIKRLEPNRFFMSPFDTAADNGDHDGDGRNLVPVTCPYAKEECLAFIRKAEAYRMQVLATYQANPADPVVEAFRKDESKREWAKVGVKSYPEFVALSAASIENQTAQIGFAYNMAHMALMAFADRVPTLNNALVAHSFFVGHYEEQLAGYDPDYHQLYRILLDDSGFWDNGVFDHAAYFEEVKRLNLAVKHSESDTLRLLRLRSMVRAHKLISAGKAKSVTLTGADLTNAVTGGFIRELSKGVFTSAGKLSGMFAQAETLLAMKANDAGATLIETLRANEDSVGAWALVRFVDRILPLLAAYGRDDEE